MVEDDSGVVYGAVDGIIEGDNGAVDGENMIKDYVDDANDEVHECVDDENDADDSDFYDPDNDIETDDDDFVSKANVAHIIERDWIVLAQNQIEPMVRKEDLDYALSDVLLSGGELDDDGTSRRYPEFNANIDMECSEFKIGMIFGSFKEFKCIVNN